MSVQHQTQIKNINLVTNGMLKNVVPVHTKEPDRGNVLKEMILEELTKKADL